MITSGLNAGGGPKLRSMLSPRLTGQPINRIPELEHLAQADWHIGEVRAHIVRQRIKVKHVLDTAQPSELVESMLHAFEASLSALEKHRELVLSQLRRRSSE
jgi:hypothetical protein